MITFYSSTLQHEQRYSLSRKSGPGIAISSLCRTHVRLYVHCGLTSVSRRDSVAVFKFIQHLHLPFDFSQSRIIISSNMVVRSLISIHIQFSTHAMRYAFARFLSQLSFHLSAHVRHIPSQPLCGIPYVTGDDSIPTHAFPSIPLPRSRFVRSVRPPRPCLAALNDPHFALHSVSSSGSCESTAFEARKLGPGAATGRFSVREEPRWR
jgi:hypothetical protein